MKKQIALIIISMLAAMSVSAQNVNEKYCNNEMCRIHERTPICEMGEGVIQPDLNCIFGSCPEKPDIPVIPETPEKPDIPVIPEIPEMPELPEVDTPLLPDIEVEPETPEAPEVPEVPEKPDIPDIPVIPEKPDIPDIPVIPEKPEQTPDIEVEKPDSSYAMQVLSIVNAERAKYGLSALTYDSTLGRAADIRAREIKSYFSHTRPNGQSCFTVLDEVGYLYRKAGENIAYGQRSASEVMQAWMNSEGHRANILGDYDYIGIGVYESGGTIYWSQFFAESSR